MLGLPSTSLRVDIQACNRILADVGRDIFGSDSHEGKTMQDLIGTYVSLICFLIHFFNMKFFICSFNLT